jgi:hypothetical protein
VQYEQYIELKRNVLTLATPQERFTAIYKDNLWGNVESVSGSASTASRTAKLRAALSELIRDGNLKTFLDVPCGDFNWMRYVVADNPHLFYIGGDIVEPLIVDNRSKFSSPRISFMQIDLTSTKLPEADVLMCRSCLQHLSYTDTKSSLARFLESQIPLFLSTTHMNSGNFVNSDIVTGDYRFIDLFAQPYLFPKEVLWRTQECDPPVHRTELCLWDRSQVQSAYSALDSWGGNTF